MRLPIPLLIITTAIIALYCIIYKLCRLLTCKILILTSIDTDIILVSCQYSVAGKDIVSLSNISQQSLVCFFVGFSVEYSFLSTGNEENVVKSMGDVTSEPDTLFLIALHILILNADLNFRNFILF